MIEQNKLLKNQENLKGFNNKKFNCQPKDSDQEDVAKHYVTGKIDEIEQGLENKMNQIDRGVNKIGERIEKTFNNWF